MRPYLLVALALALPLGCAPPEATDAAGAQLTRATRDNRDSKTRGVVGVCAGVLCASGTLIAPRVVLTAAHTVHPIWAGAFDEVRVTALDKDWDVNEPSTGFWASVPTAKVYFHPAFDWAHIHTGGHDLAVLLLDEDLPDATPLPLARAPLTDSIVGTKVRQVGYGTQTLGVQSDGYRNSIEVTVRELGPQYLLIGDENGQACVGDSGGPALLKTPESDGSPSTELVLAISSHMSGKATACNEGDYEVRIDTNLDFIDKYLSPAP